MTLIISKSIPTFYFIKDIYILYPAGTQFHQAKEDDLPKMTEVAPEMLYFKTFGIRFGLDFINSS